MALVLAAGTTAASGQQLEAAAVFRVRDFGAVGDGAAKDTAAVQRAIDAAASAGGGEVRFEDGTFLCGSLYLKSHVALHVGANAVLKASPDRADYNAADVCPQNWTSEAESNSGAHLLLCIGQTNVAVRGEGRIDGNAPAFLLGPDGKPWPGGSRGIPWRPGQMLYFVESQDVRVEGLTLENAPYWTCFFHGCERVIARGLTVRTIRRPFHTHNGDGIDVDCCEDVEVSDCDIDTADDAITLRADVDRLLVPRPCANVIVRDCRLSSGCNAVRLGVGNGEVRDAVFRNLVVRGTRTAVNAVGSWARGERGCDIRRVTFENLDIEARNFCHIYYKHATGSVFEDLAFRHVSGKVSDPSIIEDTPDRPFRNLVFEDVALDGETVPRLSETTGGQRRGEASAVFGGGLAISANPLVARHSSLVTEGGGGAASATFVPWSFDSNWKPHGSSGAARGGFVIECSPATENAADFGLVLNGEADFRETGDGGIEASWSIRPNRDGSPRFVGIQCTVPKADIPGGVMAGDTRVAISGEIPPSPHVFSGAVTNVSFLGAGGVPWLTLEFPEPQEILVQDNVRWGTQNVSLRIILVSDKMEAGLEYATKAVFRIPGSPLSLSVPEPVRAEAGPEWIPCPAPEPGTDWIEPGSALDFSGVVPHHEPAGKYGRVVAVGDHFEFENRPGEEVRFCGVNLVHGANVPDPENADRFAANLARMGYNSVRIHHHEAFLVGAKPRGNGAALDVPDRNWEKFDALVAACVRHGLYLTTDLFVSRTKAMTWRAIGIDRDGTVPDREFKLACAFYEPAYSNLVEWTRLFLTHTNRFTGRCLAEEPALCGIGLVNEGNLGRDGVEGLKKCPGFAETWTEWCATNSSLVTRHSSLGGAAAIPTDVYGRTPLHGELALFLAEREALLFGRLKAVVRGLGCEAPLSNLNAGYYPGQYLLPMRDFDYVDTHFYYYHPRFLGKNWRFPTVIEAENPLVVNGGAPSATWRRVFGKPFCITEWNWAAPGRHRAASGLVTGALAARQNWSGIWRFAWSHTKDGVEAPGSMPIRFFDLHSDPVQRASEYATMALFLRGDQPSLPPESESAEEWSEEELRDPAGGAAQFGSPRKGVSPWEHRVGTRLDHAEGKSHAEDAETAEGKSHAEDAETAEGKSHAEDAETAEGKYHAEDAETAEGKYHAEDAETAEGKSHAESAEFSSVFGGPAQASPVSGSFRVSTPRTCGGFAETGFLDCGPLSFEIVEDPSVTNHSSLVTRHSSPCRGVAAAVWATSLDGAPLAESSRILVAHVTDAANSGAVFDGPESRSWLEQGVPPALVRRGTAKIELTLAPCPATESAASDSSLVTPRSSLRGRDNVAATVYRLSPTGTRVADIPASFEGGRLRFTADTGYDPASATLFYEIVR